MGQECGLGPGEYRGYSFPPRANATAFLGVGNLGEGKFGASIDALAIQDEVVVIADKASMVGAVARETIFRALAVIAVAVDVADALSFDTVRLDANGALIDSVGCKCALGAALKAGTVEPVIMAEALRAKSIIAAFAAMLAFHTNVGISHSNEHRYKRNNLHRHTE